MDERRKAAVSLDLGQGGVDRGAEGGIISVETDPERLRIVWHLGDDAQAGSALR